MKISIFTFAGEELTTRAVRLCIKSSTPFSIEPLPDDHWEIRCKNEGQPFLQELRALTRNDATPESQTPDAAAPSPEFSFLVQSAAVADLIQAALAALPNANPFVRERLENALRTFETTTVPRSWNIEDLTRNGCGPYAAMTPDELRDALWRFQHHYETSESEWARLHNAADAVISEREPGHNILVELPEEYILAPVDEVERVLREDGCDIQEAIACVLEMPADSIIKIDTERHYDKDGHPIGLAQRQPASERPRG